MASLHVGPFRLGERIGRGGTASVWRALHAETGHLAAVKVLAARDTRRGDPLRREVEAVAALDHPHIVKLYDFGRLDEAVGPFDEGSRWLAMELADAGSLHRCDPVDWPSTGRVLLQILSALAHAHARGVLHRDLKPENVLFRGAGEVRVKITDFGIAATDPAYGEEPGEAPRHAGTPLFMAPEQLRGRWREQCPATDLYALGCIAHELCCGVAPFMAESVDRIVARHLEARPSPFDARFPVPTGLRAWVQRLYQPAPAARFAYAADAARALLALDPALSPHGALHVQGAHLAVRPSTDPPPRPSAPNEAALETLTMEPVGGADDAPAAAPREPEVPIPRSWSDALPPRPDLLVGLGAELFGVREAPLVGRVRERERLWAALRQTAGTGRPHAVVLRGPTGAGKSRLARWVCERAEELGAGVRVKAVCDPTRPGEGLRRMLARRLRCAGLSREQARARLRRLWEAQWADRVPLQDLLDLVVAEEESPGERAGSTGHPERAGLRLATLHAVLAGLAARRPAMVWIEDGESDLETLRLLRECLVRADLGPLRALFVLTVRDEGVPEPSARAVDELLQAPGARALSIAPMAHEEIRALALGMLQLEPELALEVAHRAAGSPLLAVQTLRGWVEAGSLSLGPRGLRRNARASSLPPADVQGLWERRLEPALRAAGEPARGREALELAALLGVEVDLREWADLREAVGLTLDADALLDSLTRRGLARRREGAFSFTQPSLRQALSSAAGRRSHSRRRAAEVLRARYGEDGALERRAALLLEAGDAEGAVEPLWRAAQRAWGRGEHRLVDSLLAQRERALTAAGVGPDDPRRLAGRALRARALVHAGRAEDARRFADEVFAAAERAPATALSEAALVRARLAQSRGDGEELERAAADIEALAERTGAPALYGRAALVRAELARLRGRLDDAEAGFRDAFARFEAAGDGHEAASCAVGVAEVLRQRGRTEEGERWSATASRHAARVGSRLMLAQARLVRAELARSAGELERAEALLVEAHERFRALGHPNAHLVALNLAILAVARGRYAEAEARFERAGEALRAAGMTAYLPYVDAGRLVGRAAERDWPGFDAALAAVGESLAAMGFVDPDLAGLLAAATQLARRGSARRWRDAYALARAQYEAAGAPDEARALEARMRGPG